MKKKIGGGGVGGAGVGSGGLVGGGGGQVGCERRIKVFVKIQKKKMGLVSGGGSAGGDGVGLVVGIRVDVNEELKFL